MPHDIFGLSAGRLSEFNEVALVLGKIGKKAFVEPWRTGRLPQRGRRQTCERQEARQVLLVSSDELQNLNSNDFDFLHPRMLSPFSTVTPICVLSPWPSVKN